MDAKTYVSRQGVELVNPVVVEQRYLDELKALLRDAREPLDLALPYGGTDRSLLARIDDALRSD